MCIRDSRMIGVRVPILRKIASGRSKTEFAKDFLNTLPQEYYEEYLIQMCIRDSLCITVEKR